MSNISGQLSIEILRKVVEVAAIEVAEAEKIRLAATEEKKAINKIPQGKAGGGKKAKQAANRKYKEAQSELIIKTNELENAKKILENAEQQLNREYPTDNKLLLCDSDKNDDLGSDVERQEPPMDVASESCNPSTISRSHHACRRSFSEELSVFRGNLLIDRPPAEEHPPGDVKQQEPLDNAMSQLRISELIPSDCQHLSKLQTGVSEVNQDHGSNEQNNDLEDVDVERHSTLELSTEYVLHRSANTTTTMPSGASRVSRSTSKKKLELADKSTVEAQGSEKPCRFTDGVKESGLVVFLSDPASDTDEEDKARVAEALKSKHLALSIEETRMWRFMETDEKKEYEKMARTAIHLYLQEDEAIEYGIRRMARIDPEFLPEAATTSRKLALHFLTSRDGNLMCGYHAFRNKAAYIRDGWGKPKMKVRGVPAKRDVVNSGERARRDIAKGLGNCGCMIHDILLEFALSKRIVISGFVDGNQQSEMMSFHDYMEPRSRFFAFQAIRLLVPDLSLDDFYTYGDESKHKAGVAKKRAHYWKTVNDKFQAAASLEDGKVHELNSTELGGSKVTL